MQSAALRRAYDKIDRSDKQEEARKREKERLKKRRLWDLRNMYQNENDATPLPRRAVSSKQQQEDGWLLVKTITILRPYDQKLDILWRPARAGQLEQIVARYAFHR